MFRSKLFGKDIPEIVKIKGCIMGMETISDFETFVVSYEVLAEAEGRPIIIEPFCTMWLAPRIGLVKLKITGSFRTTVLVDYELIQEQSVN